MATCLQKRKSRALFKLPADDITQNENKVETNSYILKDVTFYHLHLKVNRKKCQLLIFLEQEATIKMAYF